MTIRYLIKDFELRNAIYAGATVDIWQVDDTLAQTPVRATLYRAPTGPATLVNPQTLTSRGRYAQSVYVERPVIMTVTKDAVVETSGVTGLISRWRGVWQNATIYYPNERVRHPTEARSFVVLEAHTSSTFAGDLAAGRLEEEMDFSNSVVVDTDFIQTLIDNDLIQALIDNGVVQSLIDNGLLQALLDNGLQDILDGIGAGVAQVSEPYDLAFDWGQDAPSGRQVRPIVRTWVAPANFTNSQASVGTAPASPAVFSVYAGAGGVDELIGTVTIATDASITYATVGGVAKTVDPLTQNYVYVDPPSPADANLLGVSLTLIGTVDPS